MQLLLEETKMWNLSEGLSIRVSLSKRASKYQLLLLSICFRYGLQSHSRQEHGVVNPAIPTTSKKYKINDKRKFTFQRKKRKKVNSFLFFGKKTARENSNLDFFSFQSSSSEPEEIKISDSEPEEDPDSSESFETVERRIVISKKKPKISKSEKPFYMGLREAEILGENEAFQPKLKLEDIYKHPERHTTLPLPIKDEQDDSDQVRTDEESISKSDFVNKVRRRSESQKSSPDIEEIESKPKTVIKKERIERILKEEPMSTDEPEIIVLDWNKRYYNYF